jgi:hypothetical protein
MELVGKTVKIHLTMPLIPIDAHGSVAIIKGKILQAASDGFWVQILGIEPERKLPPYTYSTLFVPTHKVDFIGVVT